jgi:hypothetical protein
MEKSANFDQLVDTAFNLKLGIERDFMLFWFGYTIGIFIGVIYDKTDFDVDKVTLLEAQLKALVLSMKDEQGFVYQELTSFLTAFYNTGNEAIFKQQVNYLLLNAIFVATAMTESSSQGKLVFSEDPTKFDKYLKDSDTKSTKEIKLVKKNMLPKLDNTLDQIVVKLTPLTGFPLAKFYAIRVKKYLSLGNKLFDKNDIMDGLLLKYIKDYQLLTTDGKFIKSIKEIDEPQYNNIITFTQALKK